MMSYPDFCIPDKTACHQFVDTVYTFYIYKLLMAEEVGVGDI